MHHHTLKSYSPISLYCRGLVIPNKLEALLYLTELDVVIHWHWQLDVSAVFEYLSSTAGFEDDKLEHLGSRIGFADTVTLEELSASGIAPRTVYHLRRHAAESIVRIQVG